MRFHDLINIALVVALALGATAAPAASAYDGWVVRPDPDQQAAQLARAAEARDATSSWVVRPNPDEQAPLPAPPAIVRVTDGSAGFDWGDAGIGAASGVALAMLGLGGALAVSQRRPRRNTSI